MKASLALWSAVKLSVSILLVFVCIYAVGLSIKVEGSFGFCPRAIWNGEKPYTFASEFLTFIYHDSAKLISMFDSSRTLSNMSTIIMLCLSTKPVLNDASAAVNFNTIFIDSHISIKLEFPNSPPLSDKNFSGVP